MENKTILYRTLRFIVRQCLQFYCKRLSFEGLENIPADKPILFCSTHSNSFLDALFLAACMDYPVYPLARGDSFRKPLIASILGQFKMLPIFRQTDGESNAFVKNEATFQACIELFKQGKKVLIFPEGVCKHQRQVLPLKKGAATLAQRAWQADIDLRIVPVSIYYDDFFKWGKKCDIVFSKSMQYADFQDIEKINFTNIFNEKLYEAMTLMYPSPFQFRGNRLFNGKKSQILYYLGWCINAPHYAICYWLGKKMTKGTIFHDSAILGLCAVLLPFYYLTLGTIIYFIF